MKHLGLAFASAIVLSACAAQPEAPETASGKPARALPAIDKNPFPSTYKPFASTPTLIRGANIYDGAGDKIMGGEVLLVDGKVAAVGQSVSAPEGVSVIEGAGKWVTPGVIDVHSHLGNYATPAVEAHQDGNEVTGANTADVWAEHGVWPQDPGFSRALAGGITTLHILPGSANLFGGRGVSLRNVPGRTVQDMKFPGAPYTLKMACGENPKRVYGGRNQKPGSRMGNIAVDRATWAKAQEYDRKWDEYEGKVKAGTAGLKDVPARDIAMDTLRGVLDGEILVQNHCYRADEMALVLDMAKEFGYKVTAFHHAVEAYKIADLLKASGTCAAMWADWWGFKMEAYDGIRENLPFVHAAGGCAITHSDDDLGIQRLNQETAKALADGNRAGLDITPETAWTWIGINAAKALGLDAEIGSLAPGKRGDVVLWNDDPLSVYAKAEKVWIDGALMFDATTGLRPVSDFELGQPGEGDPK
ncbi:amidohydrolase [Sphingosinicella soli]|uniref:Imidazolonepropionase-like amidohydrolase n=1 Tax=Sphingosinicella soli TaxID=333708 RepID=A0A7W7F6A8_9SPHN|nr:amidohydrolase [Sphingosinicella soli]MBB4632151.1 imidazolonepropionase-like amidohydrolase [Sphingosinicella soli]